MSTITIKGIPPEVHHALKAQAKAHGRSLNKEIITTLQRATQSVPIDAGTLGNRARSVREAMGVYLTQKDLDALKAEGRR